MCVCVCVCERERERERERQCMFVRQKVLSDLGDADIIHALWNNPLADSDDSRAKIEVPPESAPNIVTCNEK